MIPERSGRAGTASVRRIARVLLATSMLLMLAGCGDEDRVRECLRDQKRYIGGQDATYLTEVVSVKVWRSYPDGRATRFVKYRLQGSDTIHSTTCLW